MVSQWYTSLLTRCRFGVITVVGAEMDGMIGMKGETTVHSVDDDMYISTNGMRSQISRPNLEYRKQREQRLKLALVQK